MKGDRVLSASPQCKIRVHLGAGNGAVAGKKGNQGERGEYRWKDKRGPQDLSNTVAGVG